MDKDIQDIFKAFIDIVDAYTKNSTKQENESNQNAVNNKAFADMVDNNMKNIIGAEDKDIDTYSSVVSVIIENAKIVDSKKLKGVDLDNIFEFFTLIDYSINMLLSKLKTQFIKAYNESRD